MRQDVKVLLSRVGDETFNYYDFETASIEIDIWPIFEALLLDERVVGRADPKALPRAAALMPEVELEAVPAPARESKRPDRHDGMFGNYGTGARSEPQGESVRDLLGRLASHAE